MKVYVSNGIIDSSSTEGNNMSVHHNLLLTHIHNNYGKCGKEFTPIDAEMQKDGLLLVVGTCPEFNNIEDEICIDYVGGYYYWVDMDNCIPIGPTVEEAYDTLTNYIFRIQQTTYDGGHEIYYS